MAFVIITTATTALFLIAVTAIRVSEHQRASLVPVETDKAKPSD